MQIDFNQLASEQIYHLLTQSLIPRPIAWVLSDNGQLDEQGRPGYNLAPFSFFNAIASAPPLLMLSLSKKPDGSSKDTLRNIIEREFFVVHLPRVDQAELVSASAATLAHGDSELQRLGLATTPLAAFPLPRLSDCALAFACRRAQIIDIGDEPQALIFGRIEQLYIDPAAVSQQGARYQIDAQRLNPLVRLGANQYAAITAPFTLERPA